MSCYIVAALLFLQSSHALGAVPAPRNVTIQSVDFEHILKWDPGPRTPPGTMYRVNVSGSGRKSGLLLLTNVTVINLTDVLKDEYGEYQISVQALYKGKLSSAPFKIFSPWRDTELGPPELSLTQSEDCLQLAVKLPRGRGKRTIEEIYLQFDFKIHLNKSGAQRVDEMTMEGMNRSICELETGVEYCVQVHTSVPANKHMNPTAWKCALVGSVKQSSAVFISLGLLAVALLLGGVVLLGLIYTGYLWKQKIHRPTVLKSLPKCNFPADFVITATPQLILERVSVNPIPAHKGKPTRTIPKLCPESSDEEDEEENPYLNRPGGPRNVLDCDETSCNSGSSALPSTANTSVENSGNSGRTVLSLDQEDPRMPVPFESSGEPENQPEVPAATVHLSPERNENMEQDCVDVNLLSVTLGTLKVEEGEDEHLENVIAEPVKVPLLSDSRTSLSPGAGQRSAEQSRTLLLVASCAETGAERSVPNSAQKNFEPSIEEDSDSEEEECSGYMRR
uniref:Cytokine receptor family B1 n=1 Tax=Scleropages formosus TaxID=113540 RepID=A0A8F8SYP6_SCLFO|nr:cytokine receptor family B1 [Scleropages formosus]